MASATWLCSTGDQYDLINQAQENLPIRSVGDWDIPQPVKGTTAKYVPSTTKTLVTVKSTVPTFEKTTTKALGSTTEALVTVYRDCFPPTPESLKNVTLRRLCPIHKKTSSPISSTTAPAAAAAYQETCWAPQLGSGRIIGGEATAKNEYPFYVRIVTGANNEYICGGSILSSGWVLTAANCFHDSEWTLVSNAFVIYGNNSNNKNLGVVDVSRYFIHPNYSICSKSKENDIAMVELCDPLDLSLPGVQPICFGEDITNIYPDSVIAIGWGVTLTDGVRHGFMQKVHLNIISNANCTDLRETPRYADTFLCTFASINDTCKGDGGGPILAIANGKWILVGIISGTDNCATNNIPTVHTKVSAYKDWILSITTASPPIFKSEKNYTSGCKITSTPAPFISTGSTSGPQCSVERLFGDNCWSKKATNMRVVGGGPAEPNEYPYQVSLFRPLGGHSCGGSILTSTWILTAGHCVVYDNGNWQIWPTIRYNTINRTEGNYIGNVTRIILNSQYTTRRYPVFHTDNDIALLQLCQPLNFDLPGVQPICFATEENINNGTAIATGWGITQLNSTVLPELLQQVIVNIVNTSECKKYIHLPTNESTSICFGAPGKGTASGDSGGPVVTEVSDGCWIQLGLVSYGSSVNISMPRVYTRISAFKYWICEHTGKC